jgi:hypothetical protein
MVAAMTRIFGIALALTVAAIIGTIINAEVEKTVAAFEVAGL